VLPAEHKEGGMEDAREAWYEARTGSQAIRSLMDGVCSWCVDFGEL
jgi:hypothetical protein